MLWGCLGILAVTATMMSCSDDDDNSDSGNEQASGYVWTTDGGLNACDHLLFTDGEEDADGNEKGKGDKENVYTGKKTRD